ncbi:MAG: ABC transporter substrate-binding protein [Planctomycetota bacterium]
MTARRFAWECLHPFLILGLLLCYVGCQSESKPPGSVTVQLNWFPETEHGGLYQAKAEGLYKNVDLDVTINPGGKQSPIGPELELGRSQFAMANADDVVLFREQGMDIVAIMAAMQNHPRCILVRQDSGVESFADLAGKTFQRQGGRAFVEFMRSKGILDGVQEVPYQGTIASLIADPNIVIQAYSCSEPLLAEQQDVAVKTLMLSEIGFNPYSSVLVTSGKLIREQPQMVQKFVDATRQGWRNYLADGQLANELILAANPEGMTSEALEFGAKAMQPLAMPDGADPQTIGMMTQERWALLVEQLTELKLVDPENVTANDCYTLEFLQ